MYVPEWLGLTMLTGVAFLCVIGGLIVVYAFTYFYFDNLLPRCFNLKYRLKLKNMDEEDLTIFLHSLVEEWTEVTGNEYEIDVRMEEHDEEGRVCEDKNERTTEEDGKETRETRK